MIELALTLAFLDVVGWIHTLVSKMSCFVKAGVIGAANLLIDGLGGLWGAAVTLLPAMPGQPSVPSFVATAFAFAHWLVPGDFLVTLFEADMAILAAWFVAASLLRWARVVE